MELQQVIETVRSQLATYETSTTYTESEEDSRWGAIGALESLLETLEAAQK